MSKITKFLFIAPQLLACAQTDADPTPRADVASPAEPAPDLASDLARPQPEMPICAHCGADLGVATVANDDELSMIINTEYIGDITGLSLIVYTSTSTYGLGMKQAVVDDLNNPSTYETIVMLDIPDAERGLLVFNLSDGSKGYEPVFIDP
jgi:hypothetical protein